MKTNETRPEVNEEATKDPVVRQARESIERWARRNPLLPMGFSKGFKIVATQTHRVARLQTRVEIERRKWVETNGEATLPSRWEVRAGVPAGFERRTRECCQAGSERVYSCSTCRGYGTVLCDACNATGWRRCGNCASPWIERRPWRSCQTCGYTLGQGMLRCESCTMGHRTCRTCGGSRTELRRNVLRIEEYPVTETELISESNRLLDAIPARELLQGKADTSHTSPLDTLRKVMAADRPDAASEAARHAIDRAQQALPDLANRATDPAEQGEWEARTPLTSYTVDLMNVIEVEYSYQGKLYTLWIIGKDAQVYAPGSPKAWIRISLMAALGVVGLLIFLASLAH
jgi:hypothetical protein